MVLLTTKLKRIKRHQRKTEETIVKPLLRNVIRLTKLDTNSWKIKSDFEFRNRVFSPCLEVPTKYRDVHQKIF